MKNEVCKKTLSGKHEFIEEEKTVWSDGEEVIKRKPGFLGIFPERIVLERTSRNVEMVGTGRYYCKHCGIYDDTQPEDE